MKNFTLFIKSNFFFIAFFVSTFVYSQSVAYYNITFTSVWNSSHHGTLPGNAHWSKLVGANHNENVTFLEMGQEATYGIERIAELGDNDEFRDNEVMPSITNGNTQQYIDGNALGSATGTINIIGLEVDEDFPLLTLVSMIAPSPDWMIAINSINLRNNDTWIENDIVIDLFAYDAGTDNGMNYNSADSNNTGGMITSLVNVAPFGSERIGYITIDFQSATLGLDEESLEQLKLYPNPSSGLINISVPDSNLFKDVVVYDVLGKSVFESRSIQNNDALDLRHLNKGIYLLKIRFENDLVKTKKIIIN